MQEGCFGRGQKIKLAIETAGNRRKSATECREITHVQTSEDWLTVLGYVDVRTVEDFIVMSADSRRNIR